MQELRPMLMAGDEQVKWLVPCVVFYYPNTALVINAVGVVAGEFACWYDTVHIRIEETVFRSLIAPIYRFRSYDEFVTSTLNRERWCLSQHFSPIVMLSPTLSELMRKYEPTEYKRSLEAGNATPSRANLILNAL